MGAPRTPRGEWVSGGGLGEGTPLFSCYASHRICSRSPALCQLGQAAVSTQGLFPGMGPFPSPRCQPAPRVAPANQGGLGTRGPSRRGCRAADPEGRFDLRAALWVLPGQRRALCLLLPATAVALAFLRLPQMVSAPDFPF